MKKFILMCMLVISAQANIDRELWEEYLSMTPKQKQVILKAFHYGEPHDYGLTLAAIAWQESHGGKHMTNLADPSFGPFHNLIGSVMNRYKVEYPNKSEYHYKWMTSRMAEKLIFDFSFAASQAIAELKFWESVHDDKYTDHNLWSRVVKSYNAGGNINSEKAEAYYNAIVKKIKILKRFYKTK